MVFITISLSEVRRDFPGLVLIFTTMKGIRIQVIYGSDSELMTASTNKWLDDNENRVVVISISPAIPKSNGGGYVTIQYTGVENVLSVPVKNPEVNQ